MSLPWCYDSIARKTANGTVDTAMDKILYGPSKNIGVYAFITGYTLFLYNYSITYM